jgi:hypothetical protein
MRKKWKCTCDSSMNTKSPKVNSKDYYSECNHRKLWDNNRKKQPLVSVLNVARHCGSKRVALLVIHVDLISADKRKLGMEEKQMKKSKKQRKAAKERQVKRKEKRIKSLRDLPAMMEETPFPAEMGGLLDEVMTCKCGKPMHKVAFPDIGLCWSCECGEYVVIEDKAEPPTQDNLADMAEDDKTASEFDADSLVADILKNQGL